MMCSVLCCKGRLKNVGTVMTCHIVLRVHNKILYSCKIFIIYKKTELDMGWGVLLLPFGLHIMQAHHHINFSYFSRCKISRRHHLVPSTSQVRLLAVLVMSRRVQIVARNAYYLCHVHPSVCPSFRLSSCISTARIRHACVRFYIEDFCENLARI